MKNINHGYLLGVDTGNSKTHAMISDINGSVLSVADTGCGNYEVIGVDGLKLVINEVVEETLAQAGVNKSEILAMGFGFAGYDWPSEANFMIEVIDSLAIQSPYDFVNDAVIGLIAGSTSGWGVSVDAGTGNNVRGRNSAGKLGRITGNSIRFGEVGGAGELVWLASVASTYAWTQRGPKTKLTELFMDYAEVQTEDELIELLAMDKIQLSPALAKDIFLIANHGDRVARDVINWTANELGLNVNAVIRQLDIQDLAFDVVLIGSLFKAGEAYIVPLRKTIHTFAPFANLIHLTVPPVVGSVLLAAETIHIPRSALREKLMESALCLMQSMEIEGD